MAHGCQLAVAQVVNRTRRYIRKIYCAAGFMSPVAKLYTQLSVYTINNPFELL